MGEEKSLQPTKPRGNLPLANEVDRTSELNRQSAELIEGMKNGLLTGEVKFLDDGTVKIRAKDKQGAVMTMTSYVNPQNGYREAGYTALTGKIDPAQRKAEATRLSGLGFTQSAIAERLGVSQKTISNDLK